MFKARLNELSQKSGWGSPRYSFIKTGDDHQPIFQASVVVNGSTFVSPATFKNSKSASNAVAEIAFSHFTTFSQVPIAETKKIKKPELVPTMGSTSDFQKGVLNMTSVCLPEDKATKSTPSKHSVHLTNESDHVVDSINKPNPNKSIGSYLLCNKVRVYTSVPNMVLPKGTAVLPIGDGMWTIVSFGSD